MNQLEIEYKTLLTEEEYTTLLPDFKEISPVEQTNYYIDSPDGAIKKARMSLRIRTFATAAEMTLKIPQTVGNLEYNQDLPLASSQALLTNFTLPDGQIKDLLTEASIATENLTILGSLTTLRYEMETEIGLMALDKNTYADQLDYELEVEVTDAQEGKENFDNYLTQKGIHFKYARSKVARFAATLSSSK